MTKHRYELRTVEHHRYPLAAVEVATGVVVGRWYDTSLESATQYVDDLNGERTRAKIEPADDSDVCFSEAIARCRKLGEKSKGNGWRRLLWRLADLLESEQ